MLAADAVPARPRPDRAREGVPAAEAQDAGVHRARRATTTGRGSRTRSRWSGIARSVARALQLNEDLTEAIALGHDLGHPPFGHAGEEALSTPSRPPPGAASGTTSTRSGSSSIWSATAAA